VPTSTELPAVAPLRLRSLPLLLLPRLR
jgi:hypothetical protein